MEKLQLDAKSGRPWKYLYGRCVAIQATMDSVYSAGVFLSPDVAIQAGENGYLFLQAYTKIAEYAVEAQRNLCFNMVPRLQTTLCLPRVVGDSSLCPASQSFGACYTPIRRFHRACGRAI